MIFGLKFKKSMDGTRPLKPLVQLLSRSKRAHNFGPNLYTNDIGLA